MRVSPERQTSPSSPYVGDEDSDSDNARNSLLGSARHPNQPSYKLVNSTDVEGHGESEACEAQWRTSALNLTNSVGFQIVMALLIVCNAVVIGLETDLPTAMHWDTFENAFLAVFTIELIVRMCLIGCQEFLHPYHPEFCWNLLDFLIVACGCIDVVVAKLRGHGSSPIATVFRIVRLLRILRIFKIVRFLKQLYMLAFGFVLALEAVFWVSVLLTIILYTWSIVLVRTVGKLAADQPHSLFLHEKFGSISRSMLTLFELFSQPNVQPYEAVLATYKLLGAFLIVFIIFESFGMLAVLTGVISDSMFAKNDVRMEEDRFRKAQRRQKLLLKCEAMYAKVEKTESGEVLKSDLEQILPQIKDMFDFYSVDIGHNDLENMIRCTDLDGSGTVSDSEFKSSMVQIVEGIRPINHMQISYGVEHIIRELRRATERELLLEQRVCGRLQAAEKSSLDAADAFQELRRDIAAMKCTGNINGNNNSNSNNNNDNDNDNCTGSYRGTGLPKCTGSASAEVSGSRGQAVLSRVFSGCTSDDKSSKKDEGLPEIRLGDGLRASADFAISESEQDTQANSDRGAEAGPQRRQTSTIPEVAIRVSSYQDASIEIQVDTFAAPPEVKHFADRTGASLTKSSLEEAQELLLATRVAECEALVQDLLSSLPTLLRPWQEYNSLTYMQVPQSEDTSALLAAKSNALESKFKEIEAEAQGFLLRVLESKAIGRAATAIAAEVARDSKQGSGQTVILE